MVRSGTALVGAPDRHELTGDYAAFDLAMRVVRRDL